MNSEVQQQEQQISISLSEQQDVLWRQFAALTNEMIITAAGRPLYPNLGYRIQGLNSFKLYAVALEFFRVDDYWYTFSNGKWNKELKSYVSSVEANIKAKKVWHVNGVMTGMQWNELPVVRFDNVMLTSNPDETKRYYINLCSMYKYVPILSVYEMNSLVPSMVSTLVAVLRIDYTEFIAVRKYQNEAVSSLKLASDPWWGSKPTRKYTRRQLPMNQVDSTSQPKREKHEESTDTPTLAGILSLPAPACASRPSQALDTHPVPPPAPEESEYTSIPSLPASACASHPSQALTTLPVKLPSPTKPTYTGVPPLSTSACAPHPSQALDTHPVPLPAHEESKYTGIPPLPASACAPRPSQTFTTLPVELPPPKNPIYTGIPPLPASACAPHPSQALAPLPVPFPAAPFPSFPPFPHHFAPNPFMVPPAHVYSPFLLQAAMMANASYYQFGGFPCAHPNFNIPTTSTTYSYVDSEKKDEQKP